MAKREKLTTNWPGAKMWPLEQIKPYPNNTRTHPDRQIELLASLLKKYGPDQPIVVDESGIILKGHGRRLAAFKAGQKDFPVVQRFGLSDDDKRAMRIADNQVALLSGWDKGLMRMEIAALDAANYAMPLLGFDQVTLDAYRPKKPDTRNPDKLPAPPKKPVVRPGDLWELGGHRILCGDSTEAATWKRLCAGERGPEKAAMHFTDPPYGVSYEARSGEFEIIEGDAKRRDDLYKMLVKSFRCMAKVSSDDAAFYIWHASSTRNDYSQAITASGLIERQYIFWAKPSIGLGYSDYRWAHEPCFYASKAEHKPAFYGAPSESTIWRVQLSRPNESAAVIGPGIVLVDGQGHTLYLLPKTPKNKKLREVRLTASRPTVHLSDDGDTGTVWEVARDRDYEHPTQKPVELARRAIENSSRRGEIVADGFAGSGTTIIGAELTGRRCFAIELDPTYAQVCIERWQAFSGQAAVMGGETLEQIAKKRQPKTTGGRNAASDTRKPIRSKPEGPATGDHPTVAK